MATFSWIVEYERAKQALATRDWDSYFLSSVENSKEMRTTYTLLGNVQAFIDWLGAKAAAERMGDADSSFFMTIGGL